MLSMYTLEFILTSAGCPHMFTREPVGWGMYNAHTWARSEIRSHNIRYIFPNALNGDSEHARVSRDSELSEDMIIFSDIQSTSHPCVST